MIHGIPLLLRSPALLHIQCLNSNTSEMNEVIIIWDHRRKFYLENHWQTCIGNGKMYIVSFLKEPTREALETEDCTKIFMQNTLLHKVYKNYASPLGQ